MIKNKDIFDFLCEKYPLSTACDFDNPGFLVGNKEKETQNVLVALDCDLKAIERAKTHGCTRL